MNAMLNSSSKPKVTAWPLFADIVVALRDLFDNPASIVGVAGDPDLVVEVKESMLYYISSVNCDRKCRTILSCEL